MRKFSPTEIDLCKKIAEKERKRIDDGDWYIRHDYDEPDVYLEGMDDDRVVARSIPLWQEHDCLEWLRQEHESILIQYIWRGWSVTISEHPDSRHPSYKYDGKTSLEALLRAVLAVLEQKDK